MGQGVVSDGHELRVPALRAAAAAIARTDAINARLVLPPNAPGMRIGLFGGTFDPPHAAHRAACLLAMKRIGLDRVWWLVTPGNPLKDTSGLAPLAARVVAARALADHPRIDVTDLEAQLGTRYTYETVAYLVRRCPQVHFVWIMGADNLRSFHRWQRWRGIAEAGADRRGRSSWTEPLRLGQRRRSGARATRAFPRRRRRTLPERTPPAWIYLHGLKSPLSSTALRAARALPRSTTERKRICCNDDDGRAVETVNAACLS